MFPFLSEKFLLNLNNKRKWRNFSSHRHNNAHNDLMVFTQISLSILSPAAPLSTSSESWKVKEFHFSLCQFKAILEHLIFSWTPDTQRAMLSANCHSLDSSSIWRTRRTTPSIIIRKTGSDMMSSISGLRRKVSSYVWLVPLSLDYCRLSMRQ